MAKKEGVELTNAEKEIVIKALDALKTAAGAVKKKSDLLGIAKAALNITEFEAQVEELKNKFL